MRNVPVLLLVLLLSLYPCALRAQSTNASITGRVTDPSKAVIGEAKVAAAQWVRRAFDKKPVKPVKPDRSFFDLEPAKEVKAPKPSGLALDL